MAHPDAVLTPVVARGWLHPREGERVHTDEVLLHLRGEGILGAVPVEAPDVDDLADVVLLLDERDHVLLLMGDEVVAGPALEDFGPGFVDALGVSLEIGEHFFDDGSEPEFEGEGPGDDEEFSPDLFETYDAGEEYPDVLVSKVVASTWPMLAYSVGSGFNAGHVDGWTVALLDEHGVDVSTYAWMPGELPGIQLTRVGDERYVQVVHSATDDVLILLSRYADLEATFDVDGFEALTNPHLAPDSEMRRLLATKRFRDVDADRLATALQSTMGEDWSTRVLAALRVPTIAADIMEGRAAVPDADRVEAGPLHRSVVDMLDRYYDAPDEEVTRRGPYGRAFAALTQTPTRAAVTVAVEAVVGTALVTASRNKRKGVRGLLASAGVFLLTDAAGHAVLAPRKFRTR